MEAMRRTSLFAVTIAIAAACGGKPKPAQEPAPATGPLGPLCERHYQRERECSSEYLAAVVALRVELDMPPGIAAEDARDGRDTVIARARVEWERDSQPAERTRICSALDAQVPAERVDSLIAEGEACQAQADCAGFAACAVAGERAFIESGAPPH